jgi:TolB-like protein
MSNGRINIFFRYPTILLYFVAITFCVVIHPQPVFAASDSGKTESESMKILEKLASELLDSLDPKLRVAVKPFSKKETGIPEALSASLVNGLVSSLQRLTNHQMTVVEREKLKKIWQEAEEFKNADFNKMVAEAGADILIIGDVRTREAGLELSFRAYDTRTGKTGKIVASTRLHYLELDWKSEAGFSPEQAAQAVEDMSSALKQLMKIGGLVADPKAPADFYHNARLLAQRGEVERALEMYKKLFKFNFRLADPIEDMVDLATTLYGKDGALEYIKGVIPKKKNHGPLLFAKQLLTPGALNDLTTALETDQIDYMPAIMLWWEKAGLENGGIMLAPPATKCSYQKATNIIKKGIKDGSISKFYFDKLRVSQKIKMINTWINLDQSNFELSAKMGDNYMAQMFSHCSGAGAKKYKTKVNEAKNSWAKINSLQKQCFELSQKLQNLPPISELIKMGTPVAPNHDCMKLVPLRKNFGCHEAGAKGALASKTCNSFFVIKVGAGYKKLSSKDCLTNLMTGKECQRLTFPEGKEPQ